MSLLSAHPASESGLQISLHPLVLLTISDYITRHTLRKSSGIIAGALLGQQSGRNITVEYAFECETIQSEIGQGEILLHEAWFKDRLQQYKDVHKAPVLDLMGWFTTGPQSGPQQEHLPIHQQILQNYNETAILLCLHPQNVVEGDLGVGGRLPLTIYESIFEGPSAGERGQMDIDDQPHRQPQQEQDDRTMGLRFRELPYSIETGEAEMIGVDFVARGGGNATAVEGAVTSAAATTPDVKGEIRQTDGKGKGKVKGKGVVKDSKPLEGSTVLSAEEEEHISSLTARANAVRMLHTRINLLKSYLTSLPPSYLTMPPTSASADASMSAPNTSDNTMLQVRDVTGTTNHQLLRSISALLARLPLLSLAPSQPPPNSASNAPISTPTIKSSYNTDFTKQELDTSLVDLLGVLGSSVKETRDLGRKFGIVDSARNASRRSGLAAGPGNGIDGAGGSGFLGPGLGGLMDDSALGGGGGGMGYRDPNSSAPSWSRDDMGEDRGRGGGMGNGIS